MTSVDVGAIAGLIGVAALAIYVLADPANKRHRRIVSMVLILCFAAAALRVTQLFL